MLSSSISSSTIPPYISRFVLNHKITVLQDEIKPKEEEIVMKTQQILDMEEELTKSVKTHNENKAIIDDIRSKLSATGSELVAGRRKVGQLQTSQAR